MPRMPLNLLPERLESPRLVIRVARPGDGAQRDVQRLGAAVGDDDLLFGECAAELHAASRDRAAQLFRPRQFIQINQAKNISRLKVYYTAVA